MENHERKPLRTSYVGGCVRRKILGVNSDGASALLQQSRAGQTDGPASQHRNVLFAGTIYFAAGEFSGSP